MKNLKKLLCGALSLTAVLTLAACGEQVESQTAASGDVPIIGISQYGQHGSLDNCREGFLQGLQEAGLVEGTDYTIDYQNASFDDNLAIQIAQAFSAEDAALMVGIATPAATACYAAAEDKDIPVYGSEIEQMKLGCVAGAGLDYVQLGIQTGKMAAKVLTGEATCQDLPYEVIENYSLYTNSQAIAAMGLTLPDEIAQQAEEVGAQA